METLMSNKAKKRDPRFEELLKKTTTVDVFGNVKVKGMYASTYINFGFDGGIISVPVSHVVFFLTHGRWPDDDKHVDHCDDDSMNNAPSNLQELSQVDNHKKRRGRQVYRSYGSGKYGPGISIWQDSRDQRWYATHQASRGHGKGDLKNVKKGLGGFKTFDEAKARADSFLRENGLI
jgi:HNH endonuclease